MKLYVFLNMGFETETEYIYICFVYRQRHASFKVIFLI